MSKIKDYIAGKNGQGEKVLSVFLTSGFPEPENFTDLALNVLGSGADMLEIGFPFSDPIADGPIIQHSSKQALEKGINLEKTFGYVKEIRKKTSKPLILMGYANPVLSYGYDKFIESCNETGVDGIIIPDLPLEELGNFKKDYFDNTDKILLITPTTSEKRLKQIDEKSSGFVYCVSVSGTTGIHNKYRDLDFIKRNYNLLENNKMLVGFGISDENDAKFYAPHCDGIIVGSAVIKSLINHKNKTHITLNFIKNLKNSLK